MPIPESPHGKNDKVNGVSDLRAEGHDGAGIGQGKLDPLTSLA